MEFTTMFKHHKRKGESFTNRIHPVYVAHINKKTGERELQIEKEVDVYAKIQEYRDEVNISKILEKYGLDMIKQLSDEEEKLIDLTNMPENLMETMAVIDSARYAWDRQSKELKAKFDNDFNKFIASSENGQLATLLNEELKTSVEKFAPHVQSEMPTQVVQASKSTAQVIQPQVIAQETTTTTPLTGGNTNV